MTLAGLRIYGNNVMFAGIMPFRRDFGEYWVLGLQPVQGDLGAISGLCPQVSGESS